MRACWNSAMYAGFMVGAIVCAISPMPRADSVSAFQSGPGGWRPHRRFSSLRQQSVS